MPTDLERQGDFSQSLIDNGGSVQIFDPATSRIANGQIIRDPFPANRIPQNRFDSLATRYMGYYPEPNQAPRPDSTSDSNYILSRSTPSNNNRWTGRLDETWNSNHSTHVSMVHYDYLANTPRAFSELEAVGQTLNDAYTTAIEHNWIATPTTVFTFKGGLVRDRSYTGSNVNVDATSWDLPADVVTLLGGTNTGRVPSITNGGVNGLGCGTLDDIHDTSYSGSISVQKVWGKHTLKAGYEHRRYYSNETTGGMFKMSSDRIVTASGPSTRTTPDRPLPVFCWEKLPGAMASKWPDPPLCRRIMARIFRTITKSLESLTLT